MNIDVDVYPSGIGVLENADSRDVDHVEVNLHNVDVVLPNSGHSSRSDRPIRGQHPHPGEGVPTFAWPTFIVAVVALAVFAAVVAGSAQGWMPPWAAIVLNTLVMYVLFVMAHETLHGSFCTTRWVSGLFGRIVWLPVIIHFSLPAFGYVHGEHHRHTNDDERDPDVFATHAPTWQLPFRWAFMDAFYAVWYLQRFRARVRKSWRRPVSEMAETSVLVALTTTLIVVSVITGHFMLLATVVLIPQRIGIFLVSWVFDWLPHHGLEVTHRENRYRSTRIRLGMEWLLAPVMLSQNYHLIHHLHPWLPFYRYFGAWRRNEALYLAHDVAVTPLFGKAVHGRV